MDTELSKVRAVHSRVEGRLWRVRGHVKTLGLQSNITELEAELERVWCLDWPTQKDEIWEGLKNVEDEIIAEAKRLSISLLG